MANGSIGTIHYMANGDTSVAKEYLEVYGGERTAILDNFRSLALHHGNRRRRERMLNQTKGHAEEVAAFVQAATSGTDMPIEFETLAAVTQATFLIHHSLDIGAPVSPETLVTQPELEDILTSSQ